MATVVHEYMMNIDAAVAVVGGGPAGASAARLLAAWGHSVLLLTKAEGATPGLAESLPPSCRKVFEAVGVRGAIDAAGFLTTGGNVVCWEGAEPRTASFGGGRGLQVERRDFDRLLLAEAQRAGAVVRSGVTVRHVGLPGDASAGGDGGAAVAWETDAASAADDGSGPKPAVTIAGRDEAGRAVEAQARFVLDCSGRAGILARRHRVRAPAGETTLALVGVWRRRGPWRLPAGARGDAPGGALDATAPVVDAPAPVVHATAPIEDDAQTVVEAYADGWAWSVPVSPERRYVTVMVDPRTTRTDRAASLRARYLAELGKTTHLARLTDGAALERPPWACDASQYHARRFGGPGFLLVGDAATFLDPLSSFGVKKAMASAWLAAIVTNTCLRHPQRAALAQRFFAEREQHIWESYRRHTAAFFAQVSRRELHRFWSDRSDPAADAGAAPHGGDAIPGGRGDAIPGSRGDAIPGGRAIPGDADASAAERALLNDPAVRDAFEALRRAPSIRLRPTAAMRTTTTPAVDGREIVAAPSLAINAGAAGLLTVRHLRGVDLPALVAMSGRHTQAPDLYAAYRQSQAPVDLPDFLAALSVLLGKGLLRNEIR